MDSSKKHFDKAPRLPLNKETFYAYKMINQKAMVMKYYKYFLL